VRIGIDLGGTKIEGIALSPRKRGPIFQSRWLWVLAFAETNRSTG